MAYYFWDNYSRRLGSRNFGDDINKWLLPNLFRSDLIDDPHVCIVGIGTLLDQAKMETLGSFRKKIIFSTGAGYGPVPKDLDESWEIACVRGPRTADKLGILQEKAITDGAVLTAEFMNINNTTEKDSILVIPHLNTGWRIGTELQNLCADLGFNYLQPDAEAIKFVSEIASARLVLTEAMHGAIIADTVRTPWICCNILYHNMFKWQDWCESMQIEYRAYRITPFAESRSSGFPRKISSVKNWALRRTVRKKLQDLAHEPPLLSDDDLFVKRKEALLAAAESINEAYKRGRY